MATKVPVLSLDQVQPAVGPLHLSLGNDGNPDITGAANAALARSVGDLGDTITNVALRARDDADHSIVLSRVSDLGSWRAQEIDSKALQTHGVQALGVADQGLSGYDDAAKKLRSTLNPRQAKIFDNQVLQERPLVERQLRVHEAQQLDVQGQHDFASMLDRTVSDAGLMWNVQDGPDTKMKMGETAILVRANLKQWSTEQTFQVLRDFRSRLVASVVGNSTAPENAGAAGAAFARQFLSKYSTVQKDEQGNPKSTVDSIDGEVAHKLWTQVAGADIRDAVEKSVSDIFANVPVSKLTGIPDLAAQTEYAMKTIKDPKILQKTVDELSQRHNMLKNGRVEQDKALADSLNNSINEWRDKNTLPSLEQIQTDARWTAMSKDGQVAVSNHYLAASDALRRQNSTGAVQEDRIKQVASKKRLTEFYDFAFNVDDDLLKKYATNPKERQWMFGTNFPELYYLDRPKAEAYLDKVYKLRAGGKLPAAYKTYVSDTILARYPGDGDRNTRNQLRGQLTSTLIEALDAETINKTDKDVRSFLTKTLNSKVWRERAMSAVDAEFPDVPDLPLDNGDQ